MPKKKAELNSNLYNLHIKHLDDLLIDQGYDYSISDIKDALYRLSDDLDDVSDKYIITYIKNNYKEK